MRDRMTVTRIPVGAWCDGPYAVVVDQYGDLWASLVHSGRIARVSAGAVAELIELGNPACRPSQLTVGPDDGIWCTRNGDDRIERVAGPTTPPGRHQCRRSVALPPGSGPYGITAGPDDALWFTAINAEAVGRLDLDGTVRMFELPHGGGMPSMITAGADGALWFTLNRTGAIGRIDLQETITVNALPDPGCGPVGITATSDGIWFVQILAARVAHLSYNGCLREFNLPERASRPHAITPAANGGCWLTLWGSNALAHVSADGHINVLDVLRDGDEPHGITTHGSTIWAALESGYLVGVDT